MKTLAIHLIWTTYGTWLPGDERGHWSALFDFYGHLQQRGHQLNIPDPITRGRAQALMKESAKVLTQGDIDIVGKTLGQYFVSPNHIAPGLPGDTPHVAPGLPGVGPAQDPRQAGGYMGVRCYAAAIEPTHVHLLVGPVEEALAKFVGRIKGVSSSNVVKANDSPQSRTWTAGY